MEEHTYSLGHWNERKWGISNSSGLDRPTDSITLRSFPSNDELVNIFKEWARLNVADGNASPTTIRAYVADLSQHLEWLRGHSLPLTEVGEEDLKRYRAYLVAEYAIKTVGRKLVPVRLFYAMACARGFLPSNPAEQIRAPRDKTERHEQVRYLSRAGVRRLLKSPDVDDPKGIRDLSILALMALHGLRVVEIHRLNMSDVDLDAGEAGALRVVGKGDKERTILLTEETCGVLKLWLKVRRLIRTESPALFVSMHWTSARAEPGYRISRRGLRQMVDGYLEEIGAKREGISCHSLRHSYATLSLSAGAPLLAISGSMGHAHVTTTQVYAKIVDKARNNPARWLTDLLG